MYMYLDIQFVFTQPPNCTVHMLAALHDHFFELIVFSTDSPVHMHVHVHITLSYKSIMCTDPATRYSHTHLVGFVNMIVYHSDRLA